MRDTAEFCVVAHVPGSLGFPTSSKFGSDRERPGYGPRSHKRFAPPPEISAKRSFVFDHHPLRSIMAKQSAQHKLDRVRPPRVQITYDVEVGGAIEIKELPFVVGVLGDFTGNPEQPLPRLKERKFVEVNPDNFDSVLEGMKPHLSFSVENKLSDDPNAANLKVDLKFRKFDDFEPANVAKQVKPLKELLDLRTRLSDLRGSLQGNDKLEELLLEAVGNTEKLDKLKGELKGEIGTGGSNA
jgi:type VI secretion system protein ImpB